MGDVAWDVGGGARWACRLDQQWNVITELLQVKEFTECRRHADHQRLARPQLLGEVDPVAWRAFREGFCELRDAVADLHEGWLGGVEGAD